LHGDVLILNTSGGDLDLTPALDLELESKLRIVWAHGLPKPGGLKGLQPDFVYAVSNFIANVVTRKWGITPAKTFVSYNAFDDGYFSNINHAIIERDVYRCVYFSHPSKGLAPAIKLLRRLRELDPRFHLEVYGGEALWGQEPQKYQNEEGVRFHGLVGQAELSRKLLESGFAIQLQTRQEPGALAIVEAMRAGCIVIGSAVGCYPEYIEHGRDGFVYAGDPEDSDLLDVVASGMDRLVMSGDSVDYVRHNASVIPWSTDTMASVWLSHWDWLTSNSSTSLFKCRFCGGGTLLFRDGYHCIQCGKYSRSMTQSAGTTASTPDLYR
jgi:hypothetical protein